MAITLQPLSLRHPDPNLLGDTEAGEDSESVACLFKHRNGTWPQLVNAIRHGR